MSTRQLPGLNFAPLTLLLALCLLVASGCSTVELRRINSAEDQPNNVWVFFSIEQDGEPVPGLVADDFEIYEDGRLVSRFESRQVIQNPDVAAVMYTMLLLDMSGSITESGEVDALVDAARLFLERVGKTQKVSVYAFDGGEKIRPVVKFTDARESVEGGLEALRTYQPQDPSTNLHGAVVHGLRTLDAALHEDDRPLKFGTLVVFTDGTDRAARVSRDEMLDEAALPQYDNFELFAIGVGAEIEEAGLAEVGRDGTELAENKARVQQAFGSVASKIEAHSKRFYLLSYCTPARKGEHAVRIEASVTDEAKSKTAKGSLEYTFNADRFGPPPSCDASRKPAFKLDRDLEPIEEKEAAAADESHDDKSVDQANKPKK
ncbi:MAG: VWA domain-containing protein [Nannocystaceae bacterium]